LGKIKIVERRFNSNRLLFERALSRRRDVEGDGQSARFIARRGLGRGDENDGSFDGQKRLAEHGKNVDNPICFRVV